MNRYGIIQAAVHAMVAGLLWLFIENLGVVKEQLAEFQAYAIPLVLAALALVFQQSDALSKIILEKVPVFSASLRRLLAGNDYVEGDWSLVVVDMIEKKPLYLGFLTITFKDGQLYVYGDDWTPDGAHAVSFRSIQSLYRDSAMHYWYEQGASLHEPDMRGYTEIYFFPHMALAERHAGKFLDVQHTTDIRFYATKVCDGYVPRRLTAKEDKFKAAMGVWQSLEPNIDALQAQRISTDFG